MARKRRDVLAHRDLFSAGAILLFVVQAAWFHRFALDDAFISYRYARNLAVGIGPVMNAGERVEGVSNLPWTALLGLLGRIGLEPHAAAPVLSFLCGLGVVGLTAALGARALRDAHAGGLAALFGAACAPVAIWGASGMETLAFTALLTTLYHRALHEHGQGRSGTISGLVLGIVASLRPEGIAYALPLLGMARGRRRWLLGVGLGTLAVFAPFLLFRVLYYGAWLPNPVVAKVTLGAAALGSGILYAGKFVAAFPALGVGVLGLRRMRGGGLLVGWIAVTFAVAITAGGERFPAYRLLVPALPALAVAAEATLRRHARAFGAHPRAVRGAALVAAGVGLVAAIVPQWLGPLGMGLLRLGRLQQDVAVHAPHVAAEMRFLGVLGLCLAAVLAWIAARQRTWTALPDVLHEAPGAHAVRGFETARELQHAQRSLAVVAAAVLGLTLLPGGLDPEVRSCRQPDPAVRFGTPVGEYLRRTLPPGTWVATNCAGSLAYFSELPVIDMLGLTDAHIARARPDRSQWVGHEKGDGDYVLSRRPALIILGGPQGSPTPWPFPGDRQIAAAAAFQHDYTLQRVAVADFEFAYYARRDAALPRR